MEIATKGQPGSACSPSELSTYAFKREIDCFADSELNNRKPVATSEDGEIAIQVVKAAYESAKTEIRVIVAKL